MHDHLKEEGLKLIFTGDFAEGEYRKYFKDKAIINCNHIWHGIARKSNETLSQKRRGTGI